MNGIVFSRKHSVSTSKFINSEINHLAHVSSSLMYVLIYFTVSGNVFLS